MRRIFAIGGLPSVEAARKLFGVFVGLTGREFPRVAYLGTASGDRAEGAERFVGLCEESGAEPVVVPLFRRTPDLKGVLSDVDAVFVGGGNTFSMLAVWRAYGLDGILRELYERGVVLGGVSAGAICWFEKALTDSWAGRLELIDGLGFLKGACAPHYMLEGERRVYTHRFLKEGRMDFAYAIDDGAALLFTEGEVERVFSAYDGAWAYRVYRVSDAIVEEPIGSPEVG